MYKLKKIVGSNNFSAQFIKIISDYKRIGYNINVLQQTACLVVNPITVGNFAFLFNCTPVGRTSDSTRVIFYVRRIGLYLYKYRIYGTISIYILKGLAFVYQLI